MHVGMLGAGSWGTALAMVLARGGHTVTIWDIDRSTLAAIAAGENTRYLPGFALPDAIRADDDLVAATTGVDMIVIAVPSTAVRSVANEVADRLAPGTLVCCVAKGIETDTLMTMHEILEEVLPPATHDSLAFLSGPSFAKEVAADMPTAVTVASRDPDTARAVQQAFTASRFRPYTTQDVMGVEIGGCVKNVIAIASGAADGLGFGANSRSALITRGLAEITRLAVARGADALTLTGLAGIGDLTLTCSSELSRNYRVGLGLGQGRRPAEIEAELGQVAEGVVNAISTKSMSEKYGVDMPISTIVYRMVHEGLPALDAMEALIGRETRPERY